MQTLHPLCLVKDIKPFTNMLLLETHLQPIYLILHNLAEHYLLAQIFLVVHCFNGYDGISILLYLVPTWSNQKERNLMMNFMRQLTSYWVDFQLQNPGDDLRSESSIMDFYEADKRFISIVNNMLVQYLKISIIGRVQHNISAQYFFRIIWILWKYNFDKQNTLKLWWSFFDLRVFVN